MSLTTGRGPLGTDPAGRMVPPVPAGAVYVEPYLRRVRGVVDGRAVVDSERTVLVHRSGRPPEYAFPEADVEVPAEPEPAAEGYVRVGWDTVDAWFEDEEQVRMHPRSPYHRVDCVPARRRLRVAVAGEVLVDTTDVLGVHETSRAPVLYVSRAAVRDDLLVPSATETYCPYKGVASYWSAVVGGTTVADVAWCYERPLPESLPLAGMLAFDQGKVDVLQEVPGWFTPPAPRTSR